MRFKGLPGFRDFYPPEMRVRRWIEDAWHRASRAAGFEEWDGPVLEPLELFTAKSGPEIVKQLYAFKDQGDREVALRPEMTPSLARVVAARGGGLPKPLKWYCVPQNFRYERPQRGRGREFLQWNADVIGASEAAADAEVIAVALQGLRLLGLTDADVRVRISDRRMVRRLLGDLGVDAEREPAVLDCIDKIERDTEAGERLASLVGDAAARELRGWCERFPTPQATELTPVFEAAEDLGIGAFLEPDFKIVRGLAYYTGPVWEIFSRGPRLRSICGGGRYDKLIAQLGGPELEACGFGMGDMSLGELLAERELAPPPAGRVDVYVIPIGDEMQRPARQVLRLLRERGVSADAPYGAPRVGKALKAADAAGARRAALVGPDEWKDRSVKLRDLATGEERLVGLDALS
jgi:histidyl-tRNA synthetase